MIWILGTLLLAPARADSFKLANGSLVEGTLATYELGGNCQIFVASGPVRGATLLLPCAEILAFSRSSPASAPGGLEVEEVRAPAAVVPLAEPAPLAAPIPVKPAAPAPSPPPVEASPSEPVSAALPAGTILPGDEPIALANPTGAQASNLRSSPRPAPPLDPSPAAAAPSATTPAAAAPSSVPASGADEPDGWRRKGEVALPRWLQRAIYGDVPPEPTPNEQGT